MGFEDGKRTGSTLNSTNELVKKGNKRWTDEREMWRDEFKRQDEYEYDRYVYGEDDSF